MSLIYCPHCPKSGYNFRIHLLELRANAHKLVALGSRLRWDQPFSRAINVIMSAECIVQVDPARALLARAVRTDYSVLKIINTALSY
jgi:hypothetical protein